MGLAGIITLLLLGIILILLEIFVVPGITIAGIGGLILLILGIYFSYSKYGVPMGHYILLGTFSLVAIIFFISYKSGAIKTMTLDTQNMAQLRTEVKQNIKIGDIGKTISRLAPMGTIMLNNELYEASSKGSFINENTEIEVVNIIDNKIIVEPKNNTI
jgi:membrane-bound ClpP family serine protease